MGLSSLGLMKMVKLFQSKTTNLLARMVIMLLFLFRGLDFYFI